MARDAYDALQFLCEEMRKRRLHGTLWRRRAKLSRNVGERQGRARQLGMGNVHKHMKVSGRVVKAPGEAQGDFIMARNAYDALQSHCKEMLKRGLRARPSAATCGACEERGRAVGPGSPVGHVQYQQAPEGVRQCGEDAYDAFQSLCEEMPKRRLRGTPWRRRAGHSRNGGERQGRARQLGMGNVNEHMKVSGSVVKALGKAKATFTMTRDAYSVFKSPCNGMAKFGGAPAQVRTSSSASSFTASSAASCTLQRGQQRHSARSQGPGRASHARRT